MKVGKTTGRVVTSLLATIAVLAFGVPAASAQESVLVLDSSVSGGAGSIEAQKAASLGYTVDVGDATTWASLTPAQFSSYRGIIFGDPFCGVGTDPYVTAAEDNADVWGPLVDGNVVLIGTDPVFHASQGGQALTDAGVAFALDEPGKTGAYITLSCYYHDTAPNTPVPLLDGFGSFTVKGVGCFNDAHIVAVHPALTGLTDDDLSNWNCSVHEAFDSWPSTFAVLAIAEAAGGEFTASDGTSGTPYILARGEDVEPISACRMSGIGNFIDTADSTEKVRKEDSLSSDLTDSQTLRVQWGPATIRNFAANLGQLNRFTLTELTSAVCSNDPAYDPGGGQTLDTFTAEGEGTFQAPGSSTVQTGYRIEITIKDGGEAGAAPNQGVGKDFVDVKVFNAAGTEVFAATGTLAHGNQNAVDDTSGGTT